MRESANDIHTQAAGPVSLVPITQTLNSVFPASPFGATRQRSVGVNELVAGVCFPMRRFPASCNHDARAMGRPTPLGLHSGGQMHERSHGRENPLRVINQADEFAQAGLPSQINNPVQLGMVMSWLANLNELDPAAKPVNHLLKALRQPPFDRHIMFSSRKR
jgi:hypothetical protein